MICPAYQSYFIFDKTALKKKFSIFENDSTIRVLSASKNNYLIAVPESYKKRTRKLQTIEMKAVMPVIADSLNTVDSLSVDNIGADIDSLDVRKQELDSTSLDAQDSVYVITKLKEKYNLDQDLYMWYFRDLLVLPDVRINEEKKKEENLKEKKTRKGFFGFLKKLFKKKHKTDSTDLNVEENPELGQVSEAEEPVPEVGEEVSQQEEPKQNKRKRKEKRPKQIKNEEDN